MDIRNVDEFVNASKEQIASALDGIMREAFSARSDEELYAKLGPFTVGMAMNPELTTKILCGLGYILLFGKKAGDEDNIDYHLVHLHNEMESGSPIMISFASANKDKTAVLDEVIAACQKMKADAAVEDASKKAKDLN